MKTLHWAYDKALDPGMGLDSAYELAAEYGKGPGTLEEKVDRFIKWQVAKATTSGFLTGLGGLLTMPVLIPANIGGVTFIHVRMAATISIMAGHDPKSDRTQTLCFLTLVGNSLKDVLKEVGIIIGRKIAVNVIDKISGVVLTKINQAIGFRLLTKFGQKGVINLGRAVPLVGGVIGGGVDYFATKAVSRAAKTIFITE
jgi:hypothetical protein